MCNSVLLFLSHCFALSWPARSCKWELVLNWPTWLNKGEIYRYFLNGKCHVWKKPGTNPVVKHVGGSIEGKMNGAKCREILDENLLQSAQDHRLGRRFIFQQNNDPKHTAKTTQEWLRDKSPNVLEWPSQSLDFNPIEHLWRDLKIAVQRHSLSNLTKLTRICRE